MHLYETEVIIRTKEKIKSKIALFIQEEKKDEKANKTLSAYERVPTMLLDFLKKEEVTKQDIIDFKKSLTEKYAPATVKLYIIILNRFIKFYELSESEDDIDLRDLRSYRTKSTVKNIRYQNAESLDDILKPADFKRMRRKAKEIGDIQMYYILSVYGFTGIRASEIKYFTIEALNMNKDYVTVTNKGKTRQVPIPGGLRRDLLKYAKSQKIKSGEIFPIKYNNILKSMKSIARKCRGINLDLVHPHSFRHLFAYYFLDQKDSNLAELADILGHSSLETTRIYVRTTTKMKKKKMECLKY